MVDFGGLADKAKGAVAEHSDQIKEGIEKVGGFIGSKIGDEKVDPIEDKLGSLVDKLAGKGDEPPAAPAPETPAV